MNVVDAYLPAGAGLLDADLGRHPSTSRLVRDAAVEVVACVPS